MEKIKITDLINYEKACGSGNLKFKSNDVKFLLNNCNVDYVLADTENKIIFYMKIRFGKNQIANGNKFAKMTGLRFEGQTSSSAGKSDKWLGFESE